MLLFTTKVAYFSIIILNFNTQSKVMLVSLPPHKFVHPSCCYYSL